jgi:SAM-dependent methyltransferase
MGRGKKRRKGRKAKKEKKQRKGEKKPPEVEFDKYALYQSAVQEPEADIEFIDEVFEKRFGRRPRTLREDFCAAAFLACEWVKHHDKNRAWGIDLDPEPLQWGREHNVATLNAAQAKRLQLIEGDAMRVEHEPADVVAAFNFSYYCLHTRAELLRYFRAAYDNLAKEGVFFLDIYGGPEAQALVEETTVHDGFHYVWDQDEFDPINSHMMCYIHFEKRSGKRVLERAFIYDWRLWTIRELREALAEAGFDATEVYWEGVDEKTGEGDGEFVLEERAENTESWIAYVTGVKLKPKRRSGPRRRSPRAQGTRRGAARHAPLSRKAATRASSRR